MACMIAPVKKMLIYPLCPIQVICGNYVLFYKYLICDIFFIKLGESYGREKKSVLEDR
jgi:hypothetical protein